MKSTKDPTPDPTPDITQALRRIPLEVIEGICTAYDITPAQLSEHERAVEICVLAMRDRGMSIDHIAAVSTLFPSPGEQLIARTSADKQRRGLDHLENLWRELGTLARFIDGPRQATASLLKVIDGMIPPQFLIRGGFVYQRKNEDKRSGDWFYSFAGFDMEGIKTFLDRRHENNRKRNDPNRLKPVARLTSPIKKKRKAGA
jgi:hypothetical protein